MGLNNLKFCGLKLTFPELLNKKLNDCPHKRAQWWRKGGEELSVTYKELGTIVKEISCALISYGFIKGDRAGIFSATNPEWMWADFGILCAGGITVCIYPTLSSGELLSQINNSGLKILFVDDEIMFEKVKAVWSEARSLEKVILFNGSPFFEDDNITTLDRFRKTGVSYLKKYPEEYEKRWKSVDISDKMTIVYSSGTTGRPKGVVHTHFSMNAASRRDLSIIPELNDDDVMLSFLPLAHTFERECGHWVALMGGLTIAYSSPQTLMDDLLVFKPTMFMGVPRIFKRIFIELRERASGSFITRALFNSALVTGLKILEKNQDENGFVNMADGVNFKEKADFFLGLKYRFFDKLIYSRVRKVFGGNLRFCFSASATLPGDLCSFFLGMGIRVLEGYGTTETCNTITLNPYEKILPGSVGPSCYGVEGKKAEDGEWLIKGDNLFLEYWNNPEATKKSFTEDGYFKTGDIVEYAREGYLRIIDRKKGMIVLDTGVTIPSARIEALFALSMFIDTIVPYGNDRKILTALVVPNFDSIISYFEKEGIPYEKENMIFEDGICVEVGRKFIENERFGELIDEEILNANIRLESWEKIKKYHISRRRLTEKTGELTPTFKVKRGVVLNNFKDELDGLYK